MFLLCVVDVCAPPGALCSAVTPLNIVVGKHVRDTEVSDNFRVASDAMLFIAHALRRVLRKRRAAAGQPLYDFPSPPCALCALYELIAAVWSA